MDPMLVSATAADLEAPLEDWGPRVGADRGQPMTAGRIMHDADGVQVGVWSCTPGSWELLDRPDTETIHILAGRARLTNAADGSSRGARRRRRPRAAQGLVRPLGDPRSGAQAVRARPLTGPGQTGDSPPEPAPGRVTVALPAMPDLPPARRS